MRRHRKGGVRFRQDTPPVKRARVNGEIKAQTILVIDATGEQLGERSLPDALRLAAEAALDLVEVAAAAQPPVCRIVDYGKFRYDAERKEKLARRNQVRVAVKEVRLRPKIGEHDFAWKLDQVRGFLEQNAKVKIAVIFRGRERERLDPRTAAARPHRSGGRRGRRRRAGGDLRGAVDVHGCRPDARSGSQFASG